VGSAALRVLVIDDDEGLGRIVARMLQPEHEVDVAASGEEALRTLGAGDDHDAIVCSLTMPGVAGDELYASLKENHPEIADRMVFVTSGTLSARGRKFITQVAERVILKPFGLSELRDVVLRAAARRAIA
jgi:CheY-like chemotaxis protein